MMAYRGLIDFTRHLESEGELIRIKEKVDPELEITEITDRVFKNGGKALLFENTGTGFPLLINMFGSEKRMSLATGRSSLEDAGMELERLFAAGRKGGGSLFSMARKLPGMKNLLNALPRRRRGKGQCQQVIEHEPDLGSLPVLKCWPHDGGPFITLPVVHTVNPVSGEVNAGMYRMQLIDSRSTGMHWHRHKTGARHFEEYKKLGKRMPVSVTLGGDPVYTYCATAPLPEGIDEYMLAGFLRRKRVKLVKCITNDLYVPEDADFVIEGYIDPSEDPVWEGPFGDHTGFYSLADWYPKFHVTAVTRRKEAIFPATIVGIPPQEDAIIGLATEKLFLSPIKLAVQPDIIDFHMPTAGVAHNLVLVKIDKQYPGQGRKVINALFGAGQMMFSKFIVVLDGDADLRDYSSVADSVSEFCNLTRDILIQSGPLDVLDHSSDTFSFGGKAGIDATRKLGEERPVGSDSVSGTGTTPGLPAADGAPIAAVGSWSADTSRPFLLVSVKKSEGWQQQITEKYSPSVPTLVIAVDEEVDLEDHYIVAWQVLSNTDPGRDIYRSKSLILVDSTAKVHPSDRFPRDWPNVVVSDESTVALVDSRWSSYGIGEFIDSPSNRFRRLVRKGGDRVVR